MEKQGKHPRCLRPTIFVSGLTPIRGASLGLCWRPIVGSTTLRRLDKAFANFFRRVKAGEEPGYPRFKSADRFNSVLFPSHGDGIRLKGNRLRVQHVGTIRVCLHREVEGKIKTLSLKREADKWFLVVASDIW